MLESVKHAVKGRHSRVEKIQRCTTTTMLSQLLNVIASMGWSHLIIVSNVTSGKTEMGWSHLIIVSNVTSGKTEMGYKDTTVCVSSLSFLVSYLSG